MNRERMDRWCEWGILGLVLVILVFGPLSTGAVRPMEFLVIQALTIGILGLWILRLWFGEHRRFLFPPIGWAVLAFTVYVIVRYFQAGAEYAAREEMIRVLIYAFLFFAVANHLHHRESTQIISFVLIFLAMGVAAYGVYQYVTDSDHVLGFIKPDQYLKRGSGTFICPNHLAGFLEMILPLSLAYVFMAKIGPVARIFIGYAGLVMLAGIGASISRGGWLATALSLVVFFIVLLRQRQYRIPAIVALVFLLGFGVAFFSNARLTQKRFSQMFVAGSLEDIRFRLWKPAVNMWEDHAWTGVGPGHFDVRFRQYRPDEVQMRPYYVHNDYLNTLVDYGVVGTVLVLSAWVLLYMGVFKTWKYVVRASSDGASRKSNKQAFVVGASIGLLAILLHSLVDFNLHIPANAILAITLMALLSSCLRFATDRHWVRASIWLKILVTLACLGGIYYLGSQGIRRSTEYVRLEKAAKQQKYSLARIEALEKAFAVEPMNYTTAYEIGECWRVQSWEGNSDYKQLAQKAMEWFDRAMKLNPYDGYAWMRYGMCLDWMGQTQEAEPYFKRGLELDPNGYYMVEHQGWHLIQLGDYAGARPWFLRAYDLKFGDNHLALMYLRLIDRRLAASSGKK
jgi:O-antigen ligase